MRTFITLCVLCAFLYSSPIFAMEEHATPVKAVPYTLGAVMSRAVQAGITPAVAVEILKSGNERFVVGNAHPRDVRQSMRETAPGQYPFASVVGCIDARVPVETVLDQGVGDVFVARVAGNVINADVLGSLEYASKAAGARAIVVLGHSGCGAVKGACDKVKMGNLTGLLAKIQPAVDSVVSTGERTSKSHPFVEAAIKANVHKSVRDIREQSPILKEMEDKGEIVIVGAVYDLASGQILWF